VNGQDDAYRTSRSTDKKGPLLVRNTAPDPNLNHLEPRDKISKGGMLVVAVQFRNADIEKRKNHQRP
jgi:hypothetical protein